MTITAATKYLGNLRTSSVHLKSGNIVVTDAPVDNNGKGEAFSPTDLMSTSLAACMMTIMGIAAQSRGFSIDGLECEVTKVMLANPRKVGEIILNFKFPKNDFSEKQKELLRHAANSCPVALSLHPDLKKTATFNF